MTDSISVSIRTSELCYFHMLSVIRISLKSYRIYINLIIKYVFEYSKLTKWSSKNITYARKAISIDQSSCLTQAWKLEKKWVFDKVESGSIKGCITRTSEPSDSTVVPLSSYSHFCPSYDAFSIRTLLLNIFIMNV